MCGVLGWQISEIRSIIEKSYLTREHIVDVLKYIMRQKGGALVCCVIRLFIGKSSSFAFRKAGEEQHGEKIGRS